MDTARGFQEARRLRAEAIVPLVRRFAGREELVELIALILAAAENLLIVGPPGTAKSLVVAEFAARIRGRYFEYLLTRFTEPSEVFGPIDIRELREGRLVTRSEGMLPDAEIAFLDEVFNAGSAILNSLLGILNDGVFRRGNQARRTELISVLGATNRIPGEPALRALEDRFTLRVECRPLDDERLPELLDRGREIESERLRAVPAAAASSFTTADLRAIHLAVAGADLTPARAPLIELVKRIRAAGLLVSDRKAVKLQRLIAASAVLCGRAAANASDLWPARYLWETEEDQELLAEIVEDAMVRARAEAPPEASAAHEHPLAWPGKRPAELLEHARHMERELERLGEPSPGLADDIQNRLQDLDGERRACRARSPQEAEELRQLGERLAHLAAALARKGGTRAPAGEGQP
jgi:MoxR-like ATPase